MENKKEVMMPISMLGREFKKTKSEKLFKELYNRLRIGVINYYTEFGKDHQLIEDSYDEAMLSVWKDIDKLNVEDYSISTNVYLKTKQHILKQNLDKARKTGDGNNFFVKEDQGEPGNRYNISQSVTSAIIVNRFVDKDSGMFSQDSQDSHENSIVRRETLNTFWNSLSSEKSYDLIYDHYFNGLKYKDLASKHFNNNCDYESEECSKYKKDIQTVKNRMAAGKKFMKRKLTKQYEEVSKILG